MMRVQKPVIHQTGDHKVSIVWVRLESIYMLMECFHVFFFFLELNQFISKLDRRLAKKQTVRSIERVYGEILDCSPPKRYRGGWLNSTVTVYQTENQPLSIPLQFPVGVGPQHHLQVQLHSTRQNFHIPSIEILCMSLTCLIHVHVVTVRI